MYSFEHKKTVEPQENQKEAQTCCRFYRIRKNGIIPRNDLLKAQLQVSKLQLSLDSATSELKH
jgi:hypothetical protein